jgi:hypothetical protein
MEVVLIKSKHTFLLSFISLPYFSNPNLCSSFVPMTIEGVLAGLSRLQQLDVHWPWWVPPGRSFKGFLLKTRWNRLDCLVLPVRSIVACFQQIQSVCDPHTLLLLVCDRILRQHNGRKNDRAWRLNCKKCLIWSENFHFSCIWNIWYIII